MHSRWAAYLVWAVLITEGAAILSGIAIELLGKPWQRSIGDTLFFEGAILLVMGGILELGRSITFSQIRALPRVGQEPPTIDRSTTAVFCPAFAKFHARYLPASPLPMTRF